MQNVIWAIWKELNVDWCVSTAGVSAPTCTSFPHQQGCALDSGSSCVRPRVCWVLSGFSGFLPRSHLWLATLIYMDCIRGMENPFYFGHT